MRVCDEGVVMTSSKILKCSNRVEIAVAAAAECTIVKWLYN